MDEMDLNQDQGTDSALSTLESSVLEQAPEQPDSQSAEENAPEITPEGDNPAAAPAPQKSLKPGQPGAVPPSYKPSFKYKVSNQEKDMAEWIRAAIRDEATEKQAKELFEKAEGLDLLKPKFQSTREELKSVREENVGIKTEVQELIALRDQDPYAFLQQVGIDDQKLFQIARDRLQYLQASPEERREWDGRIAESRRTRELERQNQYLDSQIQTIGVQARTFELNSALAKPEVKSVADAFDAQVGRSGAFIQEAIKRGQLAFYTTGQDIPAEQAVSEVLSLIGPAFKQAAPTPGTPAQNAAASAPKSGAAPRKAAATQEPPVIPAVGAHSASPMEKEITSFEDLEAAYQARLNKL